MLPTCYEGVRDTVQVTTQQVFCGKYEFQVEVQHIDIPATRLAARGSHLGGLILFRGRRQWPQASRIRRPRRARAERATL